VPSHIEVLELILNVIWIIQEANTVCTMHRRSIKFWSW